MCQEVFEIVKRMDLSQVEAKLALQCAPVILGIKMSNLLIVLNKDEYLLSRILKGTGIEYYNLIRQEKRAIYLLFRRSELIAYLYESNVRYTLVEFGYNDLSFEDVLRKFQNRYVSYMKHDEDFPHEMGLFLGYPVEDVEGFIKNKGKKYLYAGYWKVYQDVEEKKLLFEAYESAKEGLIILIANGYELPLIIRYFQKHGWKSFLIDEDALELEKFNY